MNVVNTLVLAVSLLGLPGSAAVEPPPQGPVLILPFTVDAAPGTSGLAGAPYWMGEAAAIALGDGLADLGVVTISRADRLSAFEQLQLPSSGALTRATLIRAGEMIGASAMIVGEVHLTDHMSVRARVIDLGSGRQFPEASAEGANSAFFDLVDRMSHSLVANLPREATPVAAATPTPAADRLDITTFEDYVKGLVATSPEIQARFLEAALSNSPTDARSLLAMWQVRTAQGDHAQALAAASRVPATSALSRDARFLAAQSLLALKRYDEAFKALDTLYKEEPAAALSNAIGVVQLRRTNAAAAGLPTFFFNRAADESRSDPDVTFNLGYAYALASDVTSAIYWLRETVRRAPGDGAAHLLLSAMLVAQGKSVEAQREFDLARVLGAAEAAVVPSKVVPKGLERLLPALVPPLAWQQRSVLNEEQEQTATFYLEHGQRLMAELRDREAIDELRRAVYVSPYFDAPHLLLGRIYQRNGRLQDAAEEITLALWCQETAEAHAALAGIELQQGKRDAARASANRALAIDPANAAAKEVLRLLGVGSVRGVLKSS
jgi:tetratricopeptide (TPR) repeat protein